jgi:phosphate/phosphite/phosphonate ABC transporter binding protein
MRGSTRPGHVGNSCRFDIVAIACLAALACAPSPSPPVRTGRTESPRIECRPGTAKPARLRFGVAFWCTGFVFQDGYRPMAEHVSIDLGRPVELVFVTNYDQLAMMLETGDLDVALLPPLAYVRARERMPCLKLLYTLVNDGDTRYSGYLLVHRDSPIRDLKDVAGKRIAFVDRASASGYLFPLARLISAGLDPGRDLAKASFVEDHVEVLRQVAVGEADVGASFYGALRAARIQGLDTSSLRVIAITGRIPYDALVVREGLEPDLVRAISDSFQDLNTTTESGRRSLAYLTDFDGFVPTRDSFYDSIRSVLDFARSSDPEVP